jgi:hypothetical protein
VNQQPPMHQLRMRPLKPFWDEPKTHPPCPRFFFVFRLFSAPKIFPPTYLPPPTSTPSYVSPLLPPPSYLPTSSPLLPPTYLSLHHRTPGAEWSKVQLEREQRATAWAGAKSDSLSGKGSSKAKEVGPMRDLERQLHGKLPSTNFFFFAELHPK